MILFCGIPSEPPLALAIEAAEALGAPHAVFNQRESGFCDLSLELEHQGVGGWLRVREQQYRLGGFSGVYSRLTEPAVLPEHRPGGRASPDLRTVSRSLVLHTLLSEWLEVADCRVVNRAAAMASNVSKPYQAQLIEACGFPTPPTLITNDVSAVRAYAERNGRLIYKSISSIRSIVREVDISNDADFQRLRNLPTQFQVRLIGTNVRVHVVGEQVFATEIRSPAVDYRYAGRDGEVVEMEAIALPPEIADRCRRLSRRLELPFCGIDLMRGEGGEYHCFEVNPSPAYSYYQQTTGQPIARALVEFLLGN